MEQLEEEEGRLFIGWREDKTLRSESEECNGKDNS